MDRFEVTREHAVETLIALGIVVGGIVLGRLLLALLAGIVHAIARRERRLDEFVARALRLPLLLLVVAQAVFVALRSLSYLDGHRDTVERCWVAVTLAIAVLFVQRLVSALLALAATAGASRPEGPVGQALPFVRRASNVAILLVGVLLVMDQLGIAISPLLAGLGIGGLAVALALQPLLTNLFAGSYVLSDASIRVGDYVELQSGPGGWVEGIGWRATRLRNADGHLVIVPNATLATAIVTNFGARAAQAASDVAVTLQVPLGADLERAERAALEAVRSVGARSSEVTEDPKAGVRYEGFADGSATLRAVLKARAGGSPEALAHELVKALHAALREADIPFHAEGAHRTDGSSTSGLGARPAGTSGS